MVQSFNDQQLWVRVLKTYLITLPWLIFTAIKLRLLYILNPAKLEKMMQVLAGYPMVTYATEEQKAKNLKMSVPFTLSIDERMKFLGTHRFIMKRLKVSLLDAHREAFLYKDAPNVPIYDVANKTGKKLLDFQRQYRPLVLNFGNCT